MKKKLIIIVVLLVLIGAGLAVLLFPGSNKQEEETTIDNNDTQIVEDIQKEDLPYDKDAYYEAFELHKSYNSDYVGEVVFDSGLVNEPFVIPTKEIEDYNFYINTGNLVTDKVNGCEGGECSLNDVYLRMDYKNMGYNIGGTCFMDYRNSIYDENIIIYGHHFPKYMDEERKLFFTGLEKLMEKENYEDNKYLSVVLNDEIRRYQVVYVYLFHVNPETSSDFEKLQFFRPNYNYDYNLEYDENYFTNYINRVEEVKLYDSGEKLVTSDKTLTLQTCLENDSSALEVVVCKQIDVIDR